MRHLTLAVLAALALAPVTQAQIQLDRSVFGQGGGLVASGTLQVEFTLGQPLIGAAETGSLYYDLGYWATLATSVGVASEESIKDFAIYPSKPNPFSSVTQFRFAMPRAATVSLSVYDVRGALVRTLVDGWFEPGWQVATWNGRDNDNHRLPAGVYFSVFASPGSRLTRKIVLLN